MPLPGPGPGPGPYATAACLPLNPWRRDGLLLSVLLQALVLYAAPLNVLFHTVPLPPLTLLALLALASVVLWVEEVRKMVIRRSVR